MFARPMNLKPYIFTSHFYIQHIASNLIEEAKDDAYKISMPLIISAQLGDKHLYHKALLKMQTALKNSTLSPSFQAWLYGRILIAAKHMQDKETMQTALTKLKGFLLDKDTAQDHFAAWAWGYLASFNDMEYHLAEHPMRYAAEKLTNTFRTLYYENGSVSDQQTARSNAIWAWVMIMQAAANARDHDTYDYALAVMLTFNNEISVSSALSKGLLRTNASNDYPAWAMAIVRLAAATRGDSDLFNELENPLARSMDIATVVNPAERGLAEVNNQMALAQAGARAACQIRAHL